MATPMVTDNDPGPGSIYNYHVTAQRPTAVTHSAVGHFTSPEDINLILGKTTRIEIHTVTAEGMQGVLDIPIYGRISVLQLFRPKKEAKDLLFLLTERHKFCVLEFDAATGDVVTRANGDAHDKIGRPAENGQLGVVDPDCRAIGLHLVDGMLKVIPIDESGALQEAFNIRLDELNVVDMCFLQGCPNAPTIAILYEDPKHDRHLQTYEINISQREFAAGPWSHKNLDAGASKVVPVPAPLGGALVVGEASICYFASEQPMKSVPMKPTSIQACGAIDEDGSRYLLGDAAGQLYLLALAHDGQRVAALKTTALGGTSAASQLCYLDNGVVFVGSRTGDSQLVKLHATPVVPAAPGPGGEQLPASYVEVVESFTNLGPIIDFAVVDLERQGQGQVITCSGVFQDGSLRILRSGIGINEQATVELSGVKGLWALRAAWCPQDAHDTYLVLSFVGETRVLAINEDDELDEAEIPGFNTSAQTLLCANTAAGWLVQVTAAGVALAGGDGGSAAQGAAMQWTPPAGRSINVAAASPNQVLVSIGNGELVLLEVRPGAGLVQVASSSVDREVSCLDISPVGTDSQQSSLAAVGTWGMQLSLLSLPSLSPILTEPLGGEVIPRSVLLTEFEGVAYLLCGLGDGALHTWRLQPNGTLLDKKKILLGTKPILLRTFTSNDQQHVFAASDRPTIIHSSNKKLLYSNLNENEVNFMASFNSASFPNSLAIAKEGALTIGTVDDIQKLHIRTVPLGEQPRRIAHQESTRTFGVLTVGAPASAAPGSTMDTEASYLRVLDDQTFDVVASFPLAHQEMASSIASLSFADDPRVFYAVGTGLVKPEEWEVTKGRILILQYNEGKLLLVGQKEVRGCVYSTMAFQGKLLVSVNSRVQIWNWSASDDGQGELTLECSTSCQITSLYLAARGDFVLVGDLMKSLSLLMYNKQQGGTGQLEARARDYDSKWMTAIEVLDDDTYIAADNSHNLSVIRKNSESASDEDRCRLETVGVFHAGAFINRLRHGSLVMRPPDSELSDVQTLLYGSTDGALGLVASLPKAMFEGLAALQDALRKVIHGVGGFDHEAWRTFTDMHRSEPCRGFVDGDLIEQFLDLPAEQAREVAALVGGGETVESLTRRVEELARLH